MRAHLLAGTIANQLIYPQVGVTATTTNLLVRDTGSDVNILFTGAFYIPLYPIGQEIGGGSENRMIPQAIVFTVLAGD